MSFFLVVAIFIAIVFMLRNKANTAIRKARREIDDDDSLLEQEIRAIYRQFYISVVVAFFIILTLYLFIFKIYFDWTFYKNFGY